MSTRNPSKQHYPSKIAIVDNSTWNIYNFRMPIIRRFMAAGSQVIVIAPVDQYIHYLNESHFTRHIPLNHLRPQGFTPIKDLLALWELSKIFISEKPELVLHFTIKPNILGNLAAKLAGVASCSVVTGLGYPFLHKSFTGTVAPILYRLAFRSVRKVIFYNKDDRNLFVEKKLVEAKKTHIIPGSGVNTNHFRPLTQPGKKNFIFLFVGRLLYDKGLAEYVAAAKKVRASNPDVECWVVGPFFEGNPSAVSKDQMLDWMQEQNIRYFGEADDVRKYLKMADTLVLPTYREGIPRSVQEAMAMGKPIITTQVPGAKETVEHGKNGFLVPVKSPDDLADAMIAMQAQSREELQAMGESSRQLALSKFDDRVIAESFFAVLHKKSRARTRQSGPKIASGL